MIHSRYPNTTSLQDNVTIVSARHPKNQVMAIIMSALITCGGKVCTLLTSNEGGYQSCGHKIGLVLWSACYFLRPSTKRQTRLDGKNYHFIIYQMHLIPDNYAATPAALKSVDKKPTKAISLPSGGLQQSQWPT